MWVCICDSENLQKLFSGYFNFLSKVGSKVSVESKNGGGSIGRFGMYEAVVSKWEKEHF